MTVIVPVLHDTGPLEGLLSSLPPPADAASMEVIVVSGAPDPTLAALQSRFPEVRWTSTVAGRGHQMNHGARRARGRWLLFVHADARLNAGWDGELHRADADVRVVGGSFRFALDSPSRAARIIEWGVARRVRWLELPFGDQALFVRRDVFRAIGGYRPLPLMEDVDLVRRLWTRGRLWHSDVPVHVSARRWQRDGWLRCSAENVALMALFFAGVAPERLARVYYRGSVPAASGDPRRPGSARKRRGSRLA